MIEGIIAGFKFFLLVTGGMLWVGILLFAIIYILENEVI
jgi:hypothetical protein